MKALKGFAKVLLSSKAPLICFPGDTGNVLVQVSSDTVDQVESNSEVPGDPAEDVIFGIASFGLRECGQSDQFSLYTAVYLYLDWIDTTINNFTLWQNNNSSTEQVRPHWTHLGSHDLCPGSR